MDKYQIRNYELKITILKEIQSKEASDRKLWNVSSTALLFYNCTQEVAKFQ